MSSIRVLGLWSLLFAALAGAAARGSEPEDFPATGFPMTSLPINAASQPLCDNAVIPVQIQSGPTTAPRLRIPGTPPVPPTMGPPPSSPPSAAGTPSNELPPPVEAPGTERPLAPEIGADSSALPDFARMAVPSVPSAPATAGPLGPWYFDAPIMIGDQAPPSIQQFFASTTPSAPLPGQPPLPPSPTSARSRTSAFLPSIRGFKIAENQSPRPQDRLFFSFNYFNDVNGSINSRLGAPFRQIEAYREIFGFEKTFWDGNASFGMRIPLNEVHSVSTISGLGGGSTAINSTAVFAKFILWQDPATRNLISGGLLMNLPTGPSTFAGAKGFPAFHDTQFQPFLGYIFNQGRFYAQGFEAIDAPTSAHDVTMLYNDFGIGYFLYRDDDPRAFLTAIAPTYELHLNVPLNHQGAFRSNDPAGTPDVLDMTFGTNFILARRSVLTVAFIDPVTGPRPFNFEWTLLFNYYFGGSKTARYSPMPPLTR